MDFPSLWTSGVHQVERKTTKEILYIMNVGRDENASVLSRPQGQGQTTLWASLYYFPLHPWMSSGHSNVPHFKQLQPRNFWGILFNPWDPGCHRLLIQTDAQGFFNSFSWARNVGKSYQNWQSCLYKKLSTTVYFNSKWLVSQSFCSNCAAV